jgi:hypothetical protein
MKLHFYLNIFNKKKKKKVIIFLIILFVNRNNVLHG